MCNAMRLLEMLPKFPPLSHILLSDLDTWGLYLSLCIDCKLWVLEVSPGVICTCHGLTIKKWEPIYVVQSHWHIAVSRNWKVHLQSSQQQWLLRILWSQNLMKWGDRFMSCNLSDVQKLSETHRASFQQKQITLLPPWKRFWPCLNLQLQWFQYPSCKKPLVLHWILFKYAGIVEFSLWRLQGDCCEDCGRYRTKISKSYSGAACE